MGRPRLVDVDSATPERIVEAALVAFADAGVEGARLEDIARRVGITRPSLLYHYPSKDALYVEAVHSALSQLGLALEAAMSREGDLAPRGARKDQFRERALATALAYARYLDEHPAVARLLLREMLDGRGSFTRTLQAEVVPLLERVVAWTRLRGKRHLRPGLPVRAAILQLASNLLLRAALGPMRRALWGNEDETAALVQGLFATTPRPARGAKTQAHARSLASNRSASSSKSG